jgi:hypothetical protein
VISKHPPGPGDDARKHGRASRKQARALAFILVFRSTPKFRRIMHGIFPELRPFSSTLCSIDVDFLELQR